MTVWVFRNGEWIDRNIAPPPIVSRSDLPGPMLIRDSMEPTLNPANGRRYDSKRAYERAVREAGCVIVGSETPTHSPRPISDPTQDIVQAVEKAMSRAPAKKRKKRERV